MMKYVPMEIIVGDSMHTHVGYGRDQIGDVKNVGTVLRNENLPFTLNNQTHGFEWLCIIPNTEALTGLILTW